MTIPRLELTAATLATRLYKMLLSMLQIELRDSIIWTDSQSVLKYLRNKTRRFHEFVANRIAVIHNLIDVKKLSFVDSKHNPADDASRGLTIEPFLSSKRWLHSPEFLKKTWGPMAKNHRRTGLYSPLRPWSVEGSHCYQHCYWHDRGNSSEQAHQILLIMEWAKESSGLDVGRISSYRWVRREKSRDLTWNMIMESHWQIRGFCSEYLQVMQ